MNASESSLTNCEIEDRCIAVGFSSSSFVSRCAASVGDRPKDVKVSRPSTSGAFEGSTGEIPEASAAVSGAEEGLGLYEKSDEITSRGFTAFCVFG